MKKAQGLSMNVIIIAAIALLVLVIISVLVLRAGGNVNQGTGCAGVSGQCVSGSALTGNSDCQGTLGSNYQYAPTHGCGVEGQICCIQL